MELSTKNLTLKPWKLENLQEIAKAEVDVDLKDIYDEIIRNIEENPRLRLYCDLWQIYLDNTFVGIVGFKRGLDKYGTLEIAYRVFEDYQNNGYATEAVGAVTTFALSDVRVHSIIGIVKGDNVAAARVLAKNKYKYREEVDDGNLFERGK